MEKISDIKQLSTLLSSYMKKGILTNNYTMLEDYKRYIEKEELFFQVSEAGMVILRECHNHWRGLYYLKDFNKAFTFPEDKPIAMEIVFRPGDTQYQLAISYWESMGFEPYLSRQRMSVPSLEFQLDSIDTKEVSFTKEHHAPEVHSLICKSFDPYLGCVPFLTEVTRIIKNKEILCIEDVGKIQGLLHIGNKKDIYTVWHLVVASEARNKGYAKKMLAYYTSMIPKNEKTKVQLWVKNDNISARKLYESAGFQYDGWGSVGLLYKNNS